MRPGYPGICVQCSLMLVWGHGFKSVDLFFGIAISCAFLGVFFPYVDMIMYRLSHV